MTDQHERKVDDLIKVLLAIATGTDHIKSGQHIVFIEAANRIEALEKRAKEAEAELKARRECDEGTGNCINIFMTAIAERNKARAALMRIVQHHDMVSELYTNDRDMAENFAAIARSALPPTRGDG